MPNKTTIEITKEEGVLITMLVNSGTLFMAEKTPGALDSNMEKFTDKLKDAVHEVGGCPDPDCKRK